MKDQELSQKIKDLATDILGVELSPEESLKECGVDSLGLVALVVGIEESFGFSFGDDDLRPENMKTLTDLIVLTGKYL